MLHYERGAGARTARPAVWAQKWARCKMDLTKQFDVERHTRNLAQSLWTGKRQAIVSDQETLGRRVRTLTQQINQQGPLVAQTLTWAQGLCDMTGPAVQQEAKAYLQALLATRRPQVAVEGVAVAPGAPPQTEAAQANHPTISTFLARIAHEMRAPITGVAGMADLLCETSLTPEQRLFAGTIKSSATAALVIAHDILDYAKIKAHGLNLLAEPFDLKTMIHDVTTLMLPTSRAKGISLKVDFNATLPPRFIGDAGRVRQVLTNLVSNAVKFTEQGHVLIRVVALDAEPGPHQVQITVEDTGIGIQAGDLDLIFDEFHQAAPNAGLGLGLALAKQLVQQMGGAIWVNSELGKGASFGLRLPLPVAEGTEVRADITRHLPSMAPQKPPALQWDAPHTRPMRVLVAEDNRTNQLVFQKMVRDLAVDVVFANTGVEAVDLFQSFQPDLIFMDIVMPQMDGCQAALAIRQIEAGQSHMPIIALTAQVAEDGISPFLEAGIDRHMTKPLQKATLRAMLDAFCPNAAYVLSPAVELARTVG
jgi:signal transduction histidine kinase